MNKYGKYFKKLHEFDIKYKYHIECMSNHMYSKYKIPYNISKNIILKEVLGFYTKNNSLNVKYNIFSFFLKFYSILIVVLLNGLISIFHSSNFNTISIHFSSYFSSSSISHSLSHFLKLYKSSSLR